MLCETQADQFGKIHDFARAYGSLCWNLSKASSLIEPLRTNQGICIFWHLVDSHIHHNLVIYIVTS